MWIVWWWVVHKASVVSFGRSFGQPQPPPRSRAEDEAADDDVIKFTEIIKKWHDADKKKTEIDLGRRRVNILVPKFFRSCSRLHFFVAVCCPHIITHLDCNIWDRICYSCTHTRTAIYAIIILHCSNSSGGVESYAKIVRWRRFL